MCNGRRQTFRKSLKTRDKAQASSWLFKFTSIIPALMCSKLYASPMLLAVMSCLNPLGLKLKHQRHKIPR